MVDRHTFVIPTFNRPQLVQRLARYYAKRAAAHKLLILDSSRPEVIEENSKAFANAGPQVRYLTFPQSLPSLKKILQGLEAVDTPYASFCADDDVIFPDALNQSLDFLDANVGYATAHGLYLNFRQEGSDVHVSGEYAGPGNELNAAEARVFRLLQRYESLFYGVFRTKDLVDIFRAMQVFPSAAFQELFQSVATVICGKVKRLPVFYGARQSGPPAEPGRERWQTHYWFAQNPTEVIEHYAHYCGELWKFASSRRQSPPAQESHFLKTLHLAHAVYFAEGCHPKYFYSMLQESWPGDAYVDVRQIDLLEDWGPGRRPRRLAGRLIGLMWRRWRAQSLAIGLGRLRRASAKLHRIAWRCYLPVDLHWLAHKPAFRSKWLELCSYLET